MDQSTHPRPFSRRAGALVTVVAALLLAPASTGAAPGATPGTTSQLAADAVPAPHVREGLDPQLARDDEGNRYLRGQLLVTYEPDTTRAQRRLDPSFDYRVEERFGPVDTRLLEFPDIARRAPGRSDRALERVQRELRADPAIAAAEPNYVNQTLAATNDPLLDFQWGLTRIRAPQAWPKTRGGGAVLAILDSGIDVAHPDIGRVIGSYDFVNRDRVGEDNTPHGTHVAGIAAASTGNGQGIAGTAPRSALVNMKICEYDAGEGTGLCPVSAEVEAIVAAADFGVDVINLSLGGASCTAAEREAVNYAAEKDVVIVAAAGNNGNGEVTCPAALAAVIAVGSVNIANAPSAFSNGGPWVDVAAPGGDIGNPEREDVLSTIPVRFGSYAFFQGTSMASPFVAGVAGLLSAQGRSAAEVRHRIETTAVDVGPPGFDDFTGHGLVNAERAVARPECARAKRKLAAAKQRVRRLERKLRNAETRKGRRALRRKLANAKEARSVARQHKLRACSS